MYKAAVVGSQGTVDAFRALGTDIFTVTEPAEAESLLNKFGSDYAVVFITEDIAPAIESLVQRNAKQLLPAITLLPVADSSERALQKLKYVVEKAVGADILGLGGE